MAWVGPAAQKPDYGEPVADLFVTLTHRGCRRMLALAAVPARDVPRAAIGRLGSACQ